MSCQKMSDRDQGLCQRRELYALGSLCGPQVLGSSRVFFFVCFVFVFALFCFVLFCLFVCLNIVVLTFYFYLSDLENAY